MRHLYWNTKLTSFVVFTLFATFEFTRSKRSFALWCSFSINTSCPWLQLVFICRSTDLFLLQALMLFLLQVCYDFAFYYDECQNALYKCVCVCTHVCTQVQMHMCRWPKIKIQRKAKHLPALRHRLTLFWLLKIHLKTDTHLYVTTKYLDSVKESLHETSPNYDDS